MAKHILLGKLRTTHTVTAKKSGSSGYFSVTNPAFDITPSKLIKGIVTEKGIAKYPYLNSLTQQNNGK